MNEMKKIISFCAISFLLLGSAVYAGGQTAPATPAQGGGDGARPARQRLVGEVTAVDAATGQVTVRADSGETVTLGVGEQTTYLRMPPGETKLEKGERATLADVRVGDRVLAPGVSAAGGQARQLILMSRAGGAGQGGGPGRDDGRRLAGRVVSVDAAKRLIVVQARGREGVEAVTVDASGDVRFLRFAPDSTRPADARAGSFADVKAGDTLRATGERGGAGFKAAEVLSGAFTRFSGTVTAADAAHGTLTVKNEQTGQTVTLALAARSTLRRVTPEFEQAAAQQRAEREQRREQRRAAGEGGQPPPGENRGAREGRRDGEGARGEGAGERQAGNGERRGADGERRGQGGGPRRGGGGNFQQMFESLPAIMPADLKKGDAVIVTGTPGADASHVTVITLVTGSADFLRGMQQFQRGGDGPRGMSPGLPGDVIGGGQGGTREPPRR
jgi:hypothetical protein